MALRKLLYIFMFVILSIPASSQEMIGIVMGNYAGVNSTMVNPALMMNSKLYLDINVLSAGAFINNNYLAYSNNKCATWELLKKNSDMTAYKPEGYAFYDHYGSEFNHIPKKAYFSSRIRGPSFMIAGPKHAIALTIDQRNSFSIHNIPYHVAKFGYEGFDFEPQQGRTFIAYDMKQATVMSTEIGLSYAGQLFGDELDRISWGISVKYIIANGATFMDSRELNYNVPHDSLLIVDNLDVDYAYALPMDYGSGSSYVDGLNLGSGYGIDIGFTYQRITSKQHRRLKARNQAFCAAEFEPYDYKIGVSLMDIGVVNMKTNAQLFTILSQETFWPGVDTVTFKNLDDFSSRISTQFYGNPDSSRVGSEFKVGLPTTISVQFDGHINGGFYLAGLFNYPVNLYKNSVRRPSTLYIIPRFEMRWLELSIPFSFYDFDQARMGFSIRLMNLTVGVDHMACLQPLNFRGMNFYAGLKINFAKGSCKKGRKKSHTKKRKGSRYDAVRCNSYE